MYRRIDHTNKCLRSGQFIFSFFFFFIDNQQQVLGRFIVCFFYEHNLSLLKATNYVLTNKEIKTLTG